MSNLSAFPYIQEGAEAKPSLWNDVYSILSANIQAAASGPFTSASTQTLSFSTNIEVTGGGHFQQLSIGSTPPSYRTTAAVMIAVNSAFSDYLYLTDSSGARSNYVIGSRAGGTADGLNIWDASGATMIVSFSKQSIRFFQQVVGPVFDIGGALSSTYNAATFGTAADSKESRIQSAINQASIDGFARVLVPASMLSYSASSMSFIYTVQMVKEGGNWAVHEVEAYGARGDGVRDDKTAIQQALNVAGTLKGKVVLGGKTYLLASSIDPFNFAGQLMEGASGFQTVLKAKAGFTGTFVVGLALPAAGTSAYNVLRDIQIDLSSQSLTGVTLASVNNSVLEQIRVTGGTNYANRIGAGFEFAAPLLSGAYTNCLQNCRASYCSTGVLWGIGANQNIVVGGGYESNGVAFHAAPGGGGVDTPKALFSRLEANTTGVKDGATAGVWIGLRLESQVSSDFEYTAASIRPCVVAALHASTPANAAHLNLALATYPMIIDSNARVYIFAGGGNMGLGDTTYIGADPSVALTGVSGEKLVVAGGRVYLDNNQWLCHRNSGNTGTVFTVLVDTSNNIQLGSTSDVLAPHALTIGGGFRESGITIARFENTFANLPVSSTGSGLEVGINAGVSLLQSFNRTGGVYIPATYDAISHTFGQGPVRVPTGTALLPSYAISSDVSLGWYRSNISTMALSYGQLSLFSGSNTTPSIGISDLSLGLYKSGAQTIAASQGTFNLATNAVRLSMRTVTSMDSTTLAVNEISFSIAPGSSGASLGIRSGGTIYFFASSSSTKG